MNTTQTKILTKNTLKRVRSLAHKKYRHLENQLLIEGLLSLQEAMASNYVIREIFYNPYIMQKPGVPELLEQAKAAYGTICYETDQTTIRQISSEITPQGICAVADLQEFSADDLGDKILIMDQIQDPGNSGTLFRIAHWFDLSGIILIRGTVDPSNPKSIRSSMGSFFHIPYIYAENLSEDILAERQLLVSRVHTGIPVAQVDVSDRFALIMGNEARGVSCHVDHLPHKDITLPRLGGAESLNAAVASAALLSSLLYTR